ncbi:MAG: oligosaccharide flippase family protein [Deinococcota bacterium]
MIIKRLKTLLPQRSTHRNVTLIAAGTIFGQALMLGALPLLTRFYDPRDFGAMAVFLALLVPLNSVASLRYELAIPLPKDDTEAEHLLLLSLLITVILSFVVGLVVALFASDIIRFTEAERLHGYMWLLPPTFLAAGIYLALSHYAIRQQAFSKLAAAKLGEGAGQSLSQLCLGAIGFGLGGLIVGVTIRFWVAIGAFAGIIKPWLQQYATHVTGWRAQSFKQVFSRAGVLFQLAQTYQRFPRYNATATFLQFSSLHLPALLLAIVYGTEVAGWFSLGQRVLEAPVTFLSKSASQVYLSEASQIIRRDARALHSLYTRTLIRQSKLGIFIVIAMLPAPWIFPILFGADWQPTGRYVQVLSVMFFLQFLTQAFAAETLTVLNRQHWQLGLEITKILLILGLFIYLYYNRIGHLQAVILYGLIATLIQAAYLLICWGLSKNLSYDTSSSLP